jgi:hypothetical protein
MKTTNNLSGLPVSRMVFELRTSRIWSWSAKHSAMATQTFNHKPVVSIISILPLQQLM